MTDRSGISPARNVLRRRLERQDVAANRYHDQRLGAEVVNIVVGGCVVTDDPNVVITTTLGSCVAACLYDPVAEIGGMNRVDAVLEAARLRLRPILMTSFAFIMGVVPLVTSHGAGAEMRHAMGVAVFSGMLGVTFFGLIFTPLFYVLIRAWNERSEARRQARRERRLLAHAARES